MGSEKEWQQRMVVNCWHVEEQKAENVSHTNLHYVAFYFFCDGVLPPLNKELAA